MSNSDKSFREWLPEELTGWRFMNVGDGKNGNSKERSWEDCKAHRFMIAGGDKKFVDKIKKLKKGYKLLAYTDTKDSNGNKRDGGYVGVGIVRSEAMPEKDFIFLNGKRMIDVIKTFKTPSEDERIYNKDVNKSDWCVQVNWIKKVDRSKGKCCDLVMPRHTVCEMHQPDRVRAILKALCVNPDDFNPPLRQAA